MRVREGLPYMLIGGAMVMAYLGMRNGEIQNMVSDVMSNIRDKGMDELEDMM